MIGDEIMKIMLACAMGLSTSLLVSKMKEAAKLQNKDYKIWAVDIESIEDNEDCDVILIGPQVSHRIAEVKDAIDTDSIPVEVINRDSYGKCDGAAVLKVAEQLVEQSKI